MTSLFSATFGVWSYLKLRNFEVGSSHVLTITINCIFLGSIDSLHSDTVTVVILNVSCEGKKSPKEEAKFHYCCCCCCCWAICAGCLCCTMEGPPAPAGLLILSSSETLLLACSSLCQAVCRTFWLG